MGSEQPRQLRLGGVGLLERVVQEARRDHVIWRARLVEERAHLERMEDERLAVYLAPLPFMQAPGILDRDLRLWQRARKLQRA